MSAAAAAVGEEAQEKIINEEYKVWKKNCPFLYDVVVTHALEWPSLTVQWLPDKAVPVPPSGSDDRDPKYDYTVQRMLMGTHTSGGEPNHLMVAEIRLPKEELEFDISKFGDPGSSRDGENGAFGAVAGRVEIVQKINHRGEVNRARYMWQNPNIIATKTADSDVLVFDRTKHSSKPDKDGVCNPDLILKGHKKEGYGLAWNPHTSGYVVSGSDDGIVCVWDINATGSPSSNDSCATLSPLGTCSEGHTSVVEDVAWHMHNDRVFGSVGDDRTLCLWDARNLDKGSPSHKITDAHTAEVNSIAFNPFNEFLVATASSDSTLGLWDLRNMSGKIHSLVAHGDEVFGAAWSPYCETILSSHSSDRRVMVWDLGNIGADMSNSMDNAPDSNLPSELLFIHGGHTDKISDFSWNPNEEWVMASVADNNVLQVWGMAESIYSPVDDTDLDPGFVATQPGHLGIAEDGTYMESTNSPAMDLD